MVRVLQQAIKTFKFAKNFRKYKRATSESEKIKAAKLISTFIKHEGGIFLKVAQYMGTSKEHSLELQKLSHLDDIGIKKEKAYKILKKESPSFVKHIKVFPEQIATASIGQVHKVSYKGEDWAVKIQYPHIRKELTRQLRLMNLIPTKKIEKKWGLDINLYREMVKRLIDDELDYKKEANKQREIATLMGESPYYIIPKVLDEHSGDKVIITEYLEGLNADELSELSIKYKKSLSTSLAFTYLSLFKNGYTQGDSNHGNFIFVWNGEQVRTGLIDFGQFYNFEETFVTAFFSFLCNLIDGRGVNYIDYYCALGFKLENLLHIKEHLGILTEVIFKPFLVNKSLNLECWKYKEEIDQILGENKWWFRTAGGEEFFLVIKSFLGFKNLVQKNNGVINWQQIFKEVVVERKECYLSYTPPKQLHSKLENRRELLVEIKEGKSTIALIREPISSILDIKNILSDDLQKKIKKENIDIVEIVKKSLSDGVTSGDIFFLETDRSYRISII